MTPNDLQTQLVKYLTDAHSIEHQALMQMKMAPGSPATPKSRRHSSSTSPRPKSMSGSWTSA